MTVAQLVDVLVEGVKPLDLPFTSTKEHGKHFETGKPVEFSYTRNTEKAPNMGKTFGQHLEPHGRYMNHRNASDVHEPPKGWEHGTHRFQNPLVLRLGTTSGESHGWKSQLSKAFGGRTKKSLTRAVVARGHDGIVTVDGEHTSEIVSLR